ncbi:MAG TPA: NAD(P)/FAD-dependent oxidoreductase [Natronosporangium sp.]|nr:NAD(P)/FAD-dependent oxidoreductase [Natronosporangium sp.]
MGTQSRPRIVIVGGGFAGYHAARRLCRMGIGAEIVLVNATDYFLYLPLLPQVAGGVLDPRRVAVPLLAKLPGVRLVLGEVDAVDTDRREVGYVDPEGTRGRIRYDRLLIAAGAVHKLLPIPGIAEHAHGFRGLPEALYLRDHLIRQIELAGATDNPHECVARCTFVVVGAGYTGTEVAAHGHLLTRAMMRRHPRLHGIRTRWLLLDIAPRPLPELDERLGRAAAQVLNRRGVELRMETSVAEATAGGVRLSDGEFVPSRTLVWCVGVRPDPLVESLRLPTRKGRLVVDEYLRVPDRPEIFASGDAAAAPVLDRPGEISPMTAQYAVRQGKVAAANLAASLGRGRLRPYRHRELGFVVDLGGVQAVANPMGRVLTGPVAAAVTQGFHLWSIPGNRLRIAADWLLSGVQPRQIVQLGLVGPPQVPLDTASPEVVTRAG